MIFNSEIDFILWLWNKCCESNPYQLNYILYKQNKYAQSLTWFSLCQSSEWTYWKYRWGGKPISVGEDFFTWRSVNHVWIGTICSLESEDAQQHQEPVFTGHNQKFCCRIWSDVGAWLYQCFYFPSLTFNCVRHHGRLILKCLTLKGWTSLIMVDLAMVFSFVLKRTCLQIDFHYYFFEKIMKKIQVLLKDSMDGPCHYWKTHC